MITRQLKLDLMARFMEIESMNPRLRQDQIAKELGCSSSTLRRYRCIINMFPPYRIPPNTNKRKQKISNREKFLKRPQITSNDLKGHQLASKDVRNENVKSPKNKSKSILKGVSIH